MPRPPKRSGHADKLDVSPEARERLRAVLDNLAGEVSMSEAAERVGVKESRFYYIREYVLQQAGKAAEMRKSGPKKPLRNPVDVERIAGLEAELRETRIELEAARLRTELALTMPHLLQDQPPPDGHPGLSERQERSGDGAKRGRHSTTGKGKKGSAKGKSSSRSNAGKGKKASPSLAKKSSKKKSARTKKSAKKY
jgi:transposase-like protein